jgi:hypothetical protein
VYPVIFSIYFAYVCVFNISSALYPAVMGTLAAFVPGSVVVFSVLPGLNGVSKLNFSKKGLNLQNKSLITVNNNNNKNK